jgi:hypothetical protein
MSLNFRDRWHEHLGDPSPMIRDIHRPRGILGVVVALVASRGATFINHPHASTHTHSRDRYALQEYMQSRRDDGVRPPFDFRGQPRKRPETWRRLSESAFSSVRRGTSMRSGFSTPMISNQSCNGPDLVRRFRLLKDRVKVCIGLDPAFELSAFEAKPRVPFSCHARAACPSCGTRRMIQTAAPLKVEGAGPRSFRWVMGSSSITS